MDGKGDTMTTATRTKGPATPGLEAAHAALPALASRYIDPDSRAWFPLSR